VNFNVCFYVKKICLRSHSIEVAPKEAGRELWKKTAGRKLTKLLVQKLNGALPILVINDQQYVGLYKNNFLANPQHFLED